MVQISTLLVASLGLLSGVANALPRPDSSINEPAVSAPNGTPITDTSMPEATSSSDSSMSSDMGSDSSTGSDMSSDSSSGSSNYGSSSDGSDSSSWGSGSDSSSYGSGSDSSSYGSGSSYGSSDNSWGSGSDDSWTSIVATSTSTAWTSYSTPSYGSGSSNWDSSGYSDCVSQCMASYGSPPSMYTPPSSTTSGSSYDGSSSDSSSSGSSGSGATHTVIVAPTQGVLRYVPFALNASVGDTIQFMWGANNHTVTKSSELTPCNKTSDSPFSSGEQNQGFMFTQVVNDTNPLFFYCGTPTHCQKGMFGIINPPNAAGATTSVSNMMPSIAANSSDVMGYSAIVAKATTGNDLAATWGSNIDMGSLPDWSHEFIAENVLYTRNFLAANKEVLQDDGSVNLGAAGSNPLMIPQDLSAALANASPASSTASSASTTPAPAAAAANSPSTTSAAAASTTPANSGALSVASSKVVVGLVAAFATFMML